MKIRSIEIPEGELGLIGGSISNIGDVVLLAGRNGSGKSRLLSLVAKYANSILLPDDELMLKKNLDDHRSGLAGVENQMEIDEKSRTPDALVRMQQNAGSLRYYEENVRNIQQRLLDGSRVSMENIGEKPVAVAYGVRDNGLQDWKDLSHIDIRSRYESINSEFNVELIRGSGLPAVKELINKYVYASHKDAGGEAALGLKRRVDSLRSLIQEFLGADLNWDDNGDPMLFGFPIFQANLSDGQRVLLQIAISLFFQDGSKEELVLLMDEPENHLHPLALINLIDRIRGKCPRAQIWIATHSVHLLAHYGPESIWFVKDGDVSYAGSKSLEVLEDLVGDENRLGELASFISLPGHHAAINFASQCLLSPRVLDTSGRDPQNGQIYEVVTRLLKRFGQIRLVDFGMGSGRLLSELSLLCKQNGVEFADKIDYIGLDEFASQEHERLCLSRLSAEYGNDKSRYFKSVLDFSDGVDSGSCHLLVMCNTLHEIPPEEWIKYFGREGAVSRWLHQDGYLLIVEDQVLPVGERAHRYGYLVLDSADLRALFGMSNEDSRFVTNVHPEPRYKNRLKAHLIPASAITNMNIETLRAALKSLERRSMQQGARLNDMAKQGQGLDHRQGREYAFWTHQHFNASAASRAFGS